MARRSNWSDSYFKITWVGGASHTAETDRRAGTGRWGAPRTTYTLMVDGALVFPQKYGRPAGSYFTKLYEAKRAAEAIILDTGQEAQR